MNTSPEINIRSYSHPDDYPAVRRLWENAGPGIQLRKSDELEEIEKKIGRDPDLFLLAESEGVLVGTVMGGFDGRRGLIYHLAVDALMRETGIGQQLMQVVEEKLKSKGCIRCYLMVTRDNEAAMKFYEKRGWSRMDSVHVYGKEL